MLQRSLLARARAVAPGAAALVLLAAACDGNAPPADPASPTPATPTPADAAAVLPSEVRDPDVVPNAGLFLPPLEAYRTDDDAETGEVEASLDHGVEYEEVRRRLVLDDAGFTSGEVVVVTTPLGAEGPEAVLDHQYGDAPRTPTEVRGVEMLRVGGAFEGEVLAWVGPNFVVTFRRGQETSDRWLEDLAEATVEAMTEG